MKTSTIFSRSHGIFRYTALYVICLAAAAVPNAAIAGEAFVTNSTRYSHGYSVSNFDIDSLSIVKGSRQFSSNAAKIYIDGSIGSGKQIGVPKKGVKRTAQVSERPQDFGKGSFGGRNSFGRRGLAFDDFTVHAAFSREEGQEKSLSATAVSGNTQSVDYFKEHSHTSSAGIR